VRKANRKDESLSGKRECQELKAIILRIAKDFHDIKRTFVMTLPGFRTQGCSAEEGLCGGFFGSGSVLFLTELRSGPNAYASVRKITSDTFSMGNRVFSPKYRAARAHVDAHSNPKEVQTGICCEITLTLSNLELRRSGYECKRTKLTPVGKDRLKKAKGFRQQTCQTLKHPLFTPDLPTSAPLDQQFGPLV
jgi:hypothetical protein